MKYGSTRAGMNLCFARGHRPAPRAIPTHELAGRVGHFVGWYHTLAPGRVAYLVPSAGTVTVNGIPVSTRDGATIVGEAQVTIVAGEAAEIVLVDVLG